MIDGTHFRGGIISWRPLNATPSGTTAQILIHQRYFWWRLYSGFNGYLSCDTTALFLMVWISIERHLLIFYPKLISKRGWKKWMFDVLPLIICLMWAPIVYLALIVIISTCENTWDYGTLLCGPPCYTYTGFLGIYDFVFNVCAPLFINILVNLLLIIRVIKEKLSFRPRINWRKHRKMILQFWAISSLHVALWSPLVIVSLIQMTGMPSFMADQYTKLEYTLYYMPLLLPITCLCAIPNLVNKIMRFIWIRRTNVVTVGDIPDTRRRTGKISRQQICI
ncbi:unnamed protein product [Adineta ricciae]|uniref:G-protein coupled receptors family 1 profile domain-containing protein n=1 Tax=Adineta ricciae TaxID=249248 RepID=A0A815K5M2_ADIRI|nr:unnamed protein product [Adineta ricciae]